MVLRCGSLCYCQQYDEASLVEVLRRVGRELAAGKDRFPDHVALQTKTLRYNVVGFVTIERLQQHWTTATVEAAIVDPPGGVTPGQPPAESTAVTITTVNVIALTIRLQQLDLAAVPVVLDGQTIFCPAAAAATGEPVMAATFVKGAHGGDIGRWTWLIHSLEATAPPPPNLSGA